MLLLRNSHLAAAGILLPVRLVGDFCISERAVVVVGVCAAVFAAAIFADSRGQAVRRSAAVRGNVRFLAAPRALVPMLGAVARPRSRVVMPERRLCLHVLFYLCGKPCARKFRGKRGKLGVNAGLRLRYLNRSLYRFLVGIAAAPAVARSRAACKVRAPCVRSAAEAVRAAVAALCADLVLVKAVLLLCNNFAAAGILLPVRLVGDFCISERAVVVVGVCAAVFAAAIFADSRGQAVRRSAAVRGNVRFLAAPRALVPMLGAVARPRSRVVMPERGLCFYVLLYLRGKVRVRKYRRAGGKLRVGAGLRLRYLCCYLRFFR